MSRRTAKDTQASSSSFVHLNPGLRPPSGYPDIMLRRHSTSPSPPTCCCHHHHRPVAASQGVYTLWVQIELITVVGGVRSSPVSIPAAHATKHALDVFSIIIPHPSLPSPRACAGPYTRSPLCCSPASNQSTCCVSFLFSPPLCLPLPLLVLGNWPLPASSMGCFLSQSTV